MWVIEFYEWKLLLLTLPGSCGKTPEKSIEDGNVIFLFPERQIDTEPEPDDDEDEEENNEVDEEKEMEKIKEFQGDLRKLGLKGWGNESYLFS